MTDITINTVRYNAETSAFEARVDIRAGNGIKRFPCAVPGPLNMDMASVRTRLSRCAEKMNANGAYLMSHI